MHASRLLKLLKLIKKMPGKSLKVQNRKKMMPMMYIVDLRKTWKHQDQHEFEDDFDVETTGL
jgi:hypothetical protein